MNKRILIALTLVGATTHAGKQPKNGGPNDPSFTKNSPTAPNKPLPTTPPTSSASIPYVIVAPTRNGLVDSTSATASQSVTTEDNSIPVAVAAIEQNQQQQQEVAPAQTTVTPVTEIRFNIKRSTYTPPTPLEPEADGYFKSFSRVDYDKIISDVLKLDTTTADAKMLDTSRDDIRKGLRDLYKDIHVSIKAKQYADAKKHLEKIQLLAFTAQEKGILPEDKKDNVVAWVNSYIEAINTLEKERINEINALRTFDTKQYNSSYNAQSQRTFNWQDLAIRLGLEDDPEQAVISFENLDKSTVTKENRSHFAQTANDLLTHLSQNADFKSVERTLSATVSHNIIPGATELNITYQKTAEEKKKIKKEMRAVIQKSLTTIAHLSAVQKQLHAIATEHYSEQIVKELGEVDTLEYENLPMNDWVKLLNEKDETQK